MPLDLLVAGFLCGTLLVVALSILWSTLKTGISPMPSSSKATHKILSLGESFFWKHSGVLITPAV